MQVGSGGLRNKAVPCAANPELPGLPARRSSKGKFHVGLICFLVLLQSAVSQQLSREQITSAFIYNFAKNIEWKKEDRISEFHFLVVSKDKAINSEMSKLAESQKLKGKPIRITTSESSDIPKDIQLIFITRGMKNLSAPVFRRIQGRNILLVTEGAEDKRIAMINLFDTDDNTIKFEINKANIINQGLKVLPDMVLLGGTEIDVAKLYKESQDTLRVKDVKIANLQQLLDSLGAQIEMSRKVIERQSQLISQQGQDILRQQNQLVKQRDTLTNQTSLLKRSQQTLKRQQSALNQQMGEIETGKKVLSEQQEKIDKQNASIDKQKKILEKQNITIAVQELIQRFLLLVIVLVVVLLYAVYRSYVSKQKANKQLREQQDMLQETVGQLKIARDKAQQYLDIAGVTLVAIDANRRVTMINRKGCEVLGKTMGEIIGKDWFETFIPENFRQNLVGNFHKLLQGELEPVEYFENPISTSARGERLFAWHNALLRDEDGNILGTLSSGEDITEKKIIEKKIQMLNQDLQERASALEAANRELEAFSYSVSHDLRAPLRSIDGFSQAILEDYADVVDERGKDYLRRVRSAAQRMAQLIDDMLKLSRVIRSEMALRDVDLTDIAKDVAEKYHGQQPERQVEIVIQPGVMVRGDGQLLRIVMENLFDNAWKYTSKHPTARIEFGKRTIDGKQVCFVKDDGAGFDMKYSQKLFGAFQRMHTTEEFSGTGIGLATVQRIIRRHGGKIWAESEVEKGATFYFSLPEKETQDGESKVDSAG